MPDEISDFTPEPDQPDTVGPEPEAPQEDSIPGVPETPVDVQPNPDDVVEGDPVEVPQIPVQLAPVTDDEGAETGQTFFEGHLPVRVSVGSYPTVVFQEGGSVVVEKVDPETGETSEESVEAVEPDHAKQLLALPWVEAAS
jgi:hypothetical protein